MLIRRGFTCNTEWGCFHKSRQPSDKSDMRSSKTDQGGKVTAILIGKNEKGSLCPVRGASNSMSVRPGTGGGAFLYILIILL